MAKKTPVPDLSISIDNASALGDQSAVSTITTAPDGSLVVTKTEIVHNPDATINVGIPPNAAGVPYFGTIAVPQGDGKIDMGRVYAENVENAIHESNRVFDERYPDAKVATLHPVDGSAAISLRTLSDLAKVEAPISVDGVSFEMGGQQFVGNDNSPAVTTPSTLSEEAKNNLGDFLLKFERKVSERDGVRKILTAGEHTIAAVGQWPTRIEQVLALPLADELDTLHEVEGLAIASFMDVGDVVRKVYLNVLGHFVKA